MVLVKTQLSDNCSLVLSTVVCNCQQSVVSILFRLIEFQLSLLVLPLDLRNDDEDADWFLVANNFGDILKFAEAKPLACILIGKLIRR